MKVRRAILVVVILAGLWSAWFGLRVILRPTAVTAREIYPPKQDSPAINHGILDRLLKRFVRNGRVDYIGLKREESLLRQYLDTIADLKAQQYGRDELLALYINAYNAATLKLIVEHLPGVSSIKDIPSAKRWHDWRWKIANETFSIDEIENKVLRVRFREPRVHFAIVCASIGCPPLRPEAYRGTDVAAQLEDQARQFNQNEQYVKLQGDQLRLSSIYDWYAGDFENAAGSVVDFVGRYATDCVKRAIQERRKSLRVDYLDYDWKLNGLAPAAGQH